MTRFFPNEWPVVSNVTTFMLLSLLFMSYSNGEENNLTESKKKHPEQATSKCVHAFYYPWYGNPDTDSQWQGHWNHPVAVRTGLTRSYPGGDDIGANFYPQSGCTSSNNPKDLDRHMRQLRRAGIGVISVSWWGIDSYTDRTIPKLLDAAAKYQIEVNFHLEPNLGYGKRNPKQVRQAIRHIIDTYGQHAAFYRCRFMQGRIGHENIGHTGDLACSKAPALPLFYIYDSYLTSPDQWAILLAPNGSQTIRNTPYDAVMIGLWVKAGDGPSLLAAHFDGYYTYFATDNFTYGSTLKNWSTLAAFAKQHRVAFIPSVGPGYIDTRIRPWNGRNTRDRENGKYYDRMFTAAIKEEPSIINITSFNEWHEGTQIEPVIPKTVGDYTYKDYRPQSPFYYLDRTSYWGRKFQKRKFQSIFR
ncbi:MAG: glycoside hydrolase family 99 protein [Pirellulales bacterium]